MIELTKRIVSLFGGMTAQVPLSFLAALSNQRLFSPFYHLVSDSEVPHVKHLYRFRKVADFRKDLDFLLKEFVPIDLFELKNKIGSGRIDKKSFFLSFDDGLSEIYNVIAPILKEKGVPATFFLNPAFIDNKALFYRYKVSLILEHLVKTTISTPKKQMIQELLKDPGIPEGLLKLRYHEQEMIDKIASILEIDFDAYLKEKQPYASTAQIRSLIGDGFTFGAHSIDHPEYRFLSFQQQLFQTKDSICSIAEAFNLDYRIFAFPFTDYGVTKTFFDEVLHPAKRVTELSFGSAGLKMDCLASHIQRFPMEGSVLPANKLIGSEYAYFLLKSVLRKNKITRST